MLILRPGRVADLPAIEAIAARSAVGVTSLPPDREKLRAKLQASEASFAADAQNPGEEIYFFVLEDAGGGDIVGTSGIVASAGFHDRFYSYRNEVIVHASQELKVSNKIHALHLCHDLTGHTLLNGFYIDPAFRQTEWPQLLSRARLLFISEFAQRFADRLVAEHPGVCDEHGRSPFWEAVGKRFFNMEYPQAERLSGGQSKTFIAELMPQYPIYVPLLPAEAQQAIGQLNPGAELPCSILLAEGFEADTYIDIFDGGPTVEARLRDLRTVQENRRLMARVVDADAWNAVPCIIANTSATSFRATIAPAGLQQAAIAGATDEEISITAGTAAMLCATAGEMLRAVPLSGSWELAS